MTITVIALLCALRLGAQSSDMQLLREVSFDSDSTAHYPYGLVEGRHTFSPVYHLFSSAIYVWQNGLAAEIAAPGGYAVSNPDYFKSLVGRYGLLPAFFYGIDRTVRNTKIGRATTPRGKNGLIYDDTERYRGR